MSNKVPQIRFNGYSDAWEERKLRDLLNKNSEKNKNLSVINVESVSNKTGFTKQTDQFEDYSVASANLSNYYVIREKQFAYNPSRINVGSIAYKDLGDEISVVSPLYVSFSTKKVLNDGFLWNWFKTASFDAQRQRLSEGGVRDTLSFNQLSEMNTMFPTYPEQEKIGSFFQQIDETIDLHQRKLDLLKEQKKGYLQKMFPKNGAKVPELRFAGFSDDWKQRKLSELMTFSNGINAPKENYGKGRKMISVMDILQEAPIKYENIRSSVKVDEKIEVKNKVENGDLVFVRSSEVREEVGWAKAYLEEKYALYSGFSIRGKKQNEFNSHFIELTLNSVNRKQLERKAGGSTRFNVSQNILNNVEIFSPTIEEQNTIDKLFKVFNDAITLHQRKLDLLKEQKKGFLQNMFV